MRPVTKIKVLGVRLAVLALGLYWLAMFSGTHLPADVDYSPQHVNDKLKHFTAFFLLGGLLCYVTTSQHWLRRFVGIGVIGMAYAAFDEFTQRFVPGRHPDVMDFLADSAGLWSAIAIYVAAKCVFEKRLRVAKFT